MNESMGATSAASEPTTQTLTAGAMLRSAREASGLHIAALAVAMKVPVKKLEALETDRLDLLPDAVFVRALASSVCRALKIDPNPVLQKLPQSLTPRLDTEVRGINAPFRVPNASSSLSMPKVLTHPTAMVVLVLLVGVAGVSLWPQSRTATDNAALSDVAAVKAEPAAKEQEQQPLFPPKSEVAESTASAPQPAISPSNVPVAASAVESAAVPAAAQVASASTSLPSTRISAPVRAASSSMTASEGIVVSFKVKGGSWVEVTDAKGVVQLRKTLFPGDSVSSSGAPPLMVVVGKADVTSVEVRGKPFPIDAYVKENVARFEVK